MSELQQKPNGMRFSYKDETFQLKEVELGDFMDWQEALDSSDLKMHAKFKATILFFQNHIVNMSDDQVDKFIRSLNMRVELPEFIAAYREASTEVQKK